MNYCVLNDDNIIENIIVCEDDAAASEFSAVPSYDGAEIGDAYAPPPPPPPGQTPEERIAALESENHLLNQKIAALTDQNDFQEELIVELAGVVYA